MTVSVPLVDKRAPLPVGVLVSGRGSNLQSIIDNIEAGRLRAQIRIVISSNSDASALERAQRHGIPTAVIVRRDFPSPTAAEQRMVEVLGKHGVELVVMAGFMHILTPYFLQAFAGRVMNIHPALLPSFPGLHAQAQAFASGVKFSGCTVHFVDEGVDTGPIIIQSVVPVYDDDTLESLTTRILREEHRIYPQAIQFYADGRLVVEGRKVRLTGAAGENLPVFHNPRLSGF